MSFCAVVNSRRVFTWFSVFCFICAVRPDVQLKLTPPQTASCGGNVTLTCNVDSSEQLEVMLLSWLAANKTICQYEEPESRCESTRTGSKHQLTLRLSNIRPVDAGHYSCKLRSNMGPKYESTGVTVGECPGRPASSVNRSHARCSFSGFYPSGSVHWFKGDANLTGSTTTEEDEDQHGLFNMQSVMNVQQVKLPLNCSLWSPTLGRYVSEQLVRSAAGSVRLQRFCLLTGFILVTSVL